MNFGRNIIRRFRVPAGAQPVLASIACLAVGVAIGVQVSAAMTSGYKVPSEAELERLCATDPDVQPRRWKYIVLHHSATEANDAASIDKYHRNKRGWVNGLGYDFVIGNGSRSGDGEIEVGERWLRQLDGAHCHADDMNRKAIGVCFVGDFEKNGGPTPAQVHSGIALVRHLAGRFSVPPENVLGHGEVSGAQTLCPGKSFPMELMRAAAADQDARR